MQELIICTTDLSEDSALKRRIDQYYCAALEGLAIGQALVAEFTVTHLVTEILVQGTVTGTVRLSCSRCLEEFEYPIAVPFAQAYPATDLEIPVEDELREAVILALPEKPLCRESCAGICPHCGKNRNVHACQCAEKQPDIRWQKLQDLIKKK